MRIKTYENEKAFKDALEDYLLTGYSIEDERKDKITLTKMKTSKIILYIGIIFISWVIGSLFMSILLPSGFFMYGPTGLYLFLQVVLLLILIVLSWKPISEAYKGEKIIIKLRSE